jgi:hypothetical protein
MQKLPAILLLFVFSQTQAQLNKGTNLLGAQLTLISSDAYSAKAILALSGKHYGSNLTATWGYVISHNFVVGAEAGFGFEHVTGIWGFPSFTRYENYSDISLTPFARYYLDLDKKNHLKIFGRAATEFVYTRRKAEDVQGSGSRSQTTASTTKPYIAVGGGLAYFTRKCVFEVSMSTQTLRLGVHGIWPRKK